MNDFLLKIFTTIQKYNNSVDGRIISQSKFKKAQKSIDKYHEVENNLKVILEELKLCSDEAKIKELLYRLHQAYENMDFYLREVHSLIRKMVGSYESTKSKIDKEKANSLNNH
ncbi:MAG: hypothetical protein WC707_04725 [Candidatus Babeliaceae bacterium]|jgi:argonaute-like protein implicated in RNA metabolism and viral defense